ncbi:copper chaperone PCu(A)C [Ramlibacter sp. AN1015]|uniref:copper chaperone PCu(A)C n=1 Tax=Ramlibacter sp. AN1015 TaxID=3133428 RepID=UPI0030C50DC1
MFSHAARRCALALSLLTAAAATAQAPLQVEHAWARVSVPGQTSSGAFMRLTAAQALQLVGASSPVAGHVEVHEMKMDGDVMRMRPLPALALPAGQAVELRPGGLHLMLMDLKAPLQAGTRVPVTLLLRDASGGEQRLPLELPVSARAPAGAPAAGGHHHKH